MPLSVVISANYTKVQAALLQLASNEIFLKNPDCLKDLVAQLVKAAPPQPAQQVPAPRDGSETKGATTTKRSLVEEQQVQDDGKNKEAYKSFWTKFKRTEMPTKKIETKGSTKEDSIPPGADSSAPAEKTPAEQAGTEPMETPGEKTRTEKTAPAEKTPAEQAGTAPMETPAEKTLTEKTVPAEKTPAEQAGTAPMETPAEKTPTEKTVLAEKPPAEKAGTEPMETPAEKTPTEKTVLAEKAPAEQAGTKPTETPAEKTPTEKTAVAEKTPLAEPAVEKTTPADPNEPPANPVVARPPAEPLPAENTTTLVKQDNGGDDFEKQLTHMMDQEMARPNQTIGPKQHVFMFAPNQGDVAAALNRSTTLDLEKAQASARGNAASTAAPVAPPAMAPVAPPEVTPATAPVAAAPTAAASSADPTAQKIAVWMLVSGVPQKVWISREEAASCGIPETPQIDEPLPEDAAESAPDEASHVDVVVTQDSKERGEKALKNGYMRFHRSIHSTLVRIFDID